MSGRNQHHIPQFFQRGFGVKRSGRRKEIWTYSDSVDPELGRIKDTAVGEDFYSAPPAAGERTLDKKITDLETPLARRVRQARELPVGAGIDAATAAEFVSHLAPRSSHLRDAMLSGFRQLTTSARELFTDPDSIEQLFGLDRDEPNEIFQRHFADAIGEKAAQLQALGLPMPLLERVVFFILRENFPATVAETIPMFQGVFQTLSDGSPDAIRQGHNRALDEAGEKNLRRELLETFLWSIHKAPDEGAILPDCVALAREGSAEMLPFMFVGKELDLVVLPLSTEQLLLGRRDAEVEVDLSSFNEDAAASSHRFFLAAHDSAALRRLTSLIGSRSRHYFESATREALDSYRPSRSGEEESAAAEPPHDPTAPEPDTPAARYELAFIGVADAETTQRINEVVQSIVAAFFRSYPMQRLEGITIAADYPAALRAVDQGVPGAAPVETVSETIGVGMARRIVVIRDGEAMARIVLNGIVGHKLVSENEADADWALNVIAGQLALVAMMELVDRALPGVLVNPPGELLQRRLYAEADSAIHGYVASYISGGFGDPAEINGTYRHLLVAALGRLKSEIEQERLAYRTHGDLDHLLAISFDAIGNVLIFAAQLLGNSAANGISPMDEEGSLAAALERGGLTAWFSDYQRHLARFRERLGRWSSSTSFSPSTATSSGCFGLSACFPGALQREFGSQFPCLPTR